MTTLIMMITSMATLITITTMTIYDIDYDDYIFNDDYIDYVRILLNSVSFLQTLSSLRVSQCIRSAKLHFVVHVRSLNQILHNVILLCTRQNNDGYV
jgi:hypothetical protein